MNWTDLHNCISHGQRRSPVLMVVAAACGKAVPGGDAIKEAVHCSKAGAVACCLILCCKAVHLHSVIL